MLTCISCSKQLPGGAAPLRDAPEEDEDEKTVAGSGDDSAATPSTRQAIKALTAQIKDVALKASGAYRHCKPCSGSARRRFLHGDAFAGSDVASGSERFHHAYRRAGSSGASTPSLRSGDASPLVSARTGFLAEAEMEGEGTAAGGGDGDEAEEWVTQVEPGVLISFLSVPQGGNDLKRIRFSREMFNKWEAQRWWAENYEKVIELYNVQKFKSQAVPLPSTLRPDDKNTKDYNPATPRLKELLPHGFQRPLTGSGALGYSSSDSLENQSNHLGKVYRHDRYLGQLCYDSAGLASSIDASVRTSSSPEEVDRSSERSVSVSIASDQEREWVEEDEPGVYITIRALPGGIRELHRVRFSRERFNEMHARSWWEENRARIHDQYL